MSFADFSSSFTEPTDNRVETDKMEYGNDFDERQRRYHSS